MSVELLDDEDIQVNNTKANTKTRPPSTNRVSKDLALFHANNKGTGTMLSINVQPRNDKYSAGLFVRMVSQTPNTKIGDKQLFDPSNSFTFKLGATETAHVLDVLTGLFDEAGNPGRDGQFAAGLVHRLNDTTKILYVAKTEHGYRMTGLFNDSKWSFNLFSRGEVTLVVDYLRRALSVLNPI
jgi:hypothetical protein